MKWVSTVCVSPEIEKNIKKCVQNTLAELGGSPDLAVLFVSSHFKDGFDRIGASFFDLLSCKTLIGCSAGGVIGDGKEVEGMPGISLTAGTLPDVEIHPFHIVQKDQPSLDGSPRLWEKLFDVHSAEEPQFLILSDPFTMALEEWLNGLDFAFPNTTKVGGLASSASHPGENALYLNQECYHSGTVGVALTGNIVLDTAVAQGCYPIGPTFQITDCKDNLMKALDGRPTLEVLSEVLSSLGREEQDLAQHSLFLGIVMDSMKETFSHGDFLIRTLLGADSEVGHLYVAASLHQGQTVQFHLRDSKASASDLETVLSEFVGSHNREQYKGAFLFSCLGRGQRLYGEPNHDSERFQHYFGKLSLGGFFCNGEIGPVGGTSYLHGYTSSFGIFRPKDVIKT